MRVTWMALVVCLGLPALASAQVPRDPFADAHASGAPASAASAAAASGNSAGGLPAPFVTRQNDVEIPFSVRPGTTPDSQPSAVRVFVSWDRGRSWHLFDERRPEDGKFRFKPKQDGEFWFATQTIDRSGKPDNPEPKQPQLRLVVDTQRPQLLVQAQVKTSGEVTVSWSGADATLNPASLKIEYQDAATSGTWEAVPLPAATAAASGQVQGQADFTPVVSSRAINLRAEIADAGGNMAYFSQRLSLMPPPPKVEGGLAYAPAADPSATPWTADDNRALAGGGEEVRIPNAVSNPFVKSGRLASSAQTNSPAPYSPSAPQWSPAKTGPSPANQSDEQSETLPPPSAAGPDLTPGSNPHDGDNFSDNPSRSIEPASPSVAPVENQNDYRPDTDYRSTPPTEYEPLPSQGDTNRDVGSTERQFNSSEQQYNASSTESIGPEFMPAPSPTQPQQDTESIDPAFGQRPRLTNSRRFSLDYDVESVGPEGVAEVELWGTTDDGRTWVKWGADPDRASPFDVEVNGEGAYGFRIVIVGKSGLATSSPQPGDAADIWVGIDSTRPAARLTGAAYGQGEAAGKLDIRWQADDANLGPRPITLAIGDRPDGAFTPIAAGLPNTGQYYWEFDPRSPRQIYLRLEVRDEAGNIALDQLTEPIRVEGLEPKGRIRGFNPAVETPRGAFRSPLFR